MEWLNMFFKNFIYLFLEKGEEREAERERNIIVQEKHQLAVWHTQGGGDQVWPPTQACALTGIKTVTFWTVGRCTTD